MSRAALATFAGVALAAAGCAAPSPGPGAHSLLPSHVAAARVKDAVVTGRSTKADVIAALGEAEVVRFHTGFEVWLYRIAEPASAAGRPQASGAEFVILFAPDGVAAKTRLRPPPQPPAQ